MFNHGFTYRYSSSISETKTVDSKASLAPLGVIENDSLVSMFKIVPLFLGTDWLWLHEFDSHFRSPATARDGLESSETNTN